LDQLLRAMSNQEGLVGHADTRVQLVLPEPVGDVDEYGRARGGRSPSRWLRLALVVLLVAAAGAAIFEVSKSSSRRELPTGSLATEIAQFAVDQAAAAGNPHPHSVTWVATTSDAASVVANGGTVSAANATGSPAYLLVVTGGGDFTVYGARVPPGATAPRGPTLVIIVDQTSWQMDGGGVNFVGAPPLDLASLGTPETDSLVGITPMSFSQFIAKYKLPSSTS
jgi:hypothetical protein